MTLLKVESSIERHLVPDFSGATGKFGHGRKGVLWEGLGGATSDGSVKSKGRFTQREIETVCAAGGRLSLAAALCCRVRYFIDRVVLSTRRHPLGTDHSKYLMRMEICGRASRFFFPLFAPLFLSPSLPPCAPSAWWRSAVTGRRG